jgi:hypothetical protein
MAGHQRHDSALVRAGRLAQSVQFGGLPVWCHAAAGDRIWLAGQVTAAGAAVLLAAWLAGPVIASRCQRRSPGGSRGGLL